MPRHTPYQRVDPSSQTALTDGLAAGAPGQPAQKGPNEAGGDGDGLSVRWVVVLLAIVLCSLHMVLATLAQHLHGVLIVSTLISMGAFATLMVGVLVVNPLLRITLRGRWFRPFNRAEMTCVFASMLVTAGIGTFGLSSVLVPLVAAPWNPEWNTPQQGWEEQVLPYLNESLYISTSDDMSAEQREANLTTIRQFREGLRPLDAQGEPMAPPAEHAPWAEKLAYSHAVFMQVPWWTWIKTLSVWMIFIGACYAMFYSLTYVALRSWIYREQLIFPLAQLSMQLLPDADSRRWLPTTLRSSGFWLAFGVAAGILSWNAAVHAEMIPGLDIIRLGLDGRTLTPMFTDTAFEGLTGGRFSLQFIIIFTAIGLAFLLPTEISFSLWFYFLVAVAMIQIAVWAGHGQSGGDFPTSFYGQNNFITAQGGGALLMFGGICLGRAIADWWRLGRGENWTQRLRSSGPVVALVLSLATITGWLIWNGLPVVWVLCVTAILVLFTMGLMRVVAEGGIYWMSIHTGPFHIYNMLGLGQFFKASAVVPLLPIYSVLFLDLKTFLAPNLPNAGKMHAEVGGGRTKFHLTLILCLIASVVVAVGLSIYVAYMMGAQQMMGWFYSGLPRYLMEESRDLSVQDPEFEPVTVFCYLVGGGWLALSLFLRQFLFWFPHPIGYVMFASTMSRALWFSFFLGWVAKKVVVNYGGKRTFELTRPIFIGLIVGELLTIFFWTIAGLAFDFSPGITDNRGSAG